MKDLVEFMVESMQTQENNNVNEGKVTDEKSFRELAEAKLKEVHGDDYDADKAKEMIDGILEDHKDLVEKGDWGALVGVLEKGIAKE